MVAQVKEGITYLNEKNIDENTKAFTGIVDGLSLQAIRSKVSSELVFKVGGEIQDARLVEGKYGPYYMLNTGSNKYFASEGKSKHGPYVRLKKLEPREENSDSDEGAGPSAAKKTYNK